VILPIPEKYLIIFNTFLCHLIYIPIAALLVLAFSLFNILLVPLAYFGHIVALIQTITDSDETMDELEEKIERAKTIVKFSLVGPIYLSISVITDIYKFFINLYT
jgi:hypothetical protein